MRVTRNLLKEGVERDELKPNTEICLHLTDRGAGVAPQPPKV